MIVSTFKSTSVMIATYICDVTVHFTPCSIGTREGGEGSIAFQSQHEEREPRDATCFYFRVAHNARLRFNTAFYDAFSSPSRLQLSKKRRSLDAKYCYEAAPCGERRSVSQFRVADRGRRIFSCFRPFYRTRRKTKSA